MTRHHTAGFTLVELLVVVAIIGVLMAIAIPAFSSRQGKAYDARVRQDARNAANAEEAQFIDTLAYVAGDCSVLPGANLSPGVTCVATVTGGGSAFVIQTTHPRATVSCTWTSNASPNLVCS
jgi:prepilin-type N-terminal cleavage/methylation domain-containing protein